MASFLLGVLTGMLIEEGCRYCARKCDKWKKQLEDLPDIVEENKETNEVQVLKAENN